MRDARLNDLLGGEAKFLWHDGDKLSHIATCIVGDANDDSTTPPTKSVDSLAPFLFPEDYPEPEERDPTLPANHMTLVLYEDPDASDTRMRA